VVVVVHMSVAVAVAEVCLPAAKLLFLELHILLLLEPAVLVVLHQAILDPTDLAVYLTRYLPSAAALVVQMVETGLPVDLVEVVDGISILVVQELLAKVTREAMANILFTVEQLFMLLAVAVVVKVVLALMESQ
jgi:hypothetical protein